MDKASKGGNVKREDLRALAETMEAAPQAGRRKKGSTKQERVALKEHGVTEVKGWPKALVSWPRAADKSKACFAEGTTGH